MAVVKAPILAAAAAAVGCAAALDSEVEQQLPESGSAGGRGGERETADQGECCGGGGPFSLAPAAAWPGEMRQGGCFGPAADRYEVGQELGSGAAARVFACRRLVSGEELAVKVVNLQRLRLFGDLAGHLSRLEREVHILQQLHHPRIVNLFGFHRTEACFFLIMERVRGGELFNQIVHKKCLSEAEARYVFRQLLEGIGYMHSKHVIHRDIKPENILIVSSRHVPDETAGGSAGSFLHEVKIADFGLSKVISEGASLAKTCVGTPQYWAPEVLNVQHGGGTYGEAADFWGLGAVLFVMLCGRYPFDGKKMPMDEQIRTATFSMTGARWKGVSESAKSFLRGLLQVNPATRLGLQDCLRHPWVVGGSCETSPMFRSLDREMAAGTDGGRNASLGRESIDTDIWAANPPYGDDGSACPPFCAPATEFLCTEELGSLRTTICHSNLPENALGKSSPHNSEISVEPISRKSTSCYSVAADDRMERTLVPTRRGWWRSPWSLLVLAALAIQLFFSFCWLRLSTSLHEGGGAPSNQHRDNSVALRLEKPHATLHAHGGSGSSYSSHTQEAPHGSVWGAPHQQQRPSSYASQLGEKASASSECPSASASKETIFRLNELLKLQVSIVGSLEMARLAFRHADSELADSTQQIFQEARELFQHAANLVLSYAQVARQVSQSILPDLQLAVEEQEPSLAVGLLGVVKSWVTDMKREGDLVRARYTELQDSVLRLARRAQATKSDADQRLAESIRRTADAETASGVVELARQRVAFESGGPQHGLSTHQAATMISDRGAAGQQTQGSRLGDTEGMNAGRLETVSAMAAPLTSMNSLTRKLFEQLGVHHTNHEVVVGGQDAEVSEDNEAWKQTVIDLLFMAPGAVPSDKVYSATTTASASAAAAGDVEDCSENEESTGQAEAEDGEREGRCITSAYADGRCSQNSDDSAGRSKSVVRYMHPTKYHDSQSAAEFAANSSAVLLRALRELRRIDGILQGCSAFWANMDGTVQKLAQMKDVTERLVGYASSSERLRERFEQRLGEYGAFWGSLESLCRQYGLDHQAAAGKMQDFVREVADTADLIDTAESARRGGAMVAAAAAAARGAGAATASSSSTSASGAAASAAAAAATAAAAAVSPPAAAAGGEGEGGGSPSFEGYSSGET